MPYMFHRIFRYLKPQLRARSAGVNLTLLEESRYRGVLGPSVV